MTGKIKYSFHELRMEDQTEYRRRLYNENKEHITTRNRLRYAQNSEVKQKCLESAAKYRKENPEYQNKHYREVRTWRTGNCQICGHFIPKKHSKYCGECGAKAERIYKTEWQRRKRSQ